VKIGIDLDDVMAICAVPYLRKFAEEFGVQLPDEQEIGWHLLSRMQKDTPYDKLVPGLEKVTPEQRDRFRMRLYDGKFFSELEPYEDSPVVIERIAAAGHELYFITARAERRRVVTETWLREKGLIQHARAVHLKPHGDFDPGVPPGRYDATSSANYKVRLAKELELDAFCEDDVLIAKSLAESGIRVWLFDHSWNRELRHPNITRVGTWTELAAELGV
jgi:uncharacterized protein